ncbi:hypothetical protein GCM10010377_21710 [Streptomyces viridiviolaceus]|uniref:Uncharacterized protein n=1 Tax=Streptomyces viridiviolaceus TaxID=68282 RepID=A0ABW2DWC6_9ACTN|nr:hypothetical protein [Streptomyces viridiviolaceus]GHB31040.1 hypothetical protein GCM10010377_21710 [Streptomyces viridiviolaceus]
MAKNKNNRDRKQPQDRRAPQTADTAVLERDEEHAAQTPSGDTPSHKRKKRFGHN